MTRHRRDRVVISTAHRKVSMIICRKGDALIHDRASMRWLHFHSPVASFRADKPEDVMPLIRDIHDQVVQNRLYAAGFISYDAAPGMDEALKSRRDEGTPLMALSLYTTPRILTWEELDITASKTVPETGGIPVWKPSIDPEEYGRDIRKVRDYIRRGHSYQVNYTYRMTADWEGDPWNLFRSMVTAQNPGYGAFLAVDDLTVCSASPELFFSLENNRIRTSPMKGTAPRGLTADDDRRQAEDLFRSEKNRAENMMIVDMIRNDLGRIARTGTVKVTELFRIEKYPTIWQMTSDVEAETDAEVPQILESLFPCASITGAPKYRTMEIIRELESTPRGLYTGTIGYWGPGGRAQFNVAIRTAVVDRERKKAVYGTGGGVVWDSTAEGEFEETLTKAGILKEAPGIFSLLETLRWSRPAGYYLLERHLDRMEDSAEYWDFAFDRETVKTLLIQKSRTFPQEGCFRVRLLLDKRGEIVIESASLPELPEEPPLWTLRTAETAIDRQNPLIYHKTTKREIYTGFREKHPDADDVILWNDRGEVTETTVCNIVAVWRGEAFTPSLSSGLLGGTLRKELLAGGEIRERVITLDELNEADEIYLINSVRGRINIHWKRGLDK